MRQSWDNRCIRCVCGRVYVIMFALAPDSQDPDCLHKLARNSVCICIHILPLHHFLVPPFASSPIPAPLSCQQPWYRITQGHHPVDKSTAAEVQGMS